MAKAVKLADIASKLGVSTVTVSKALSGQKGVSESMREKIKKLADEMGYKQPSALRQEKPSKSYNIGVLVSEQYLDKYDSFYWKMYQCVATKAVQHECFTMLEVITRENEKEIKLPKIVVERKVDGLVIVGRLNSTYLKTLQDDAGMPSVYLDFYDTTSSNDAVISNSYYGSYLLTNYLFEKGHTKIAYVGTLLFTGSITDRYFGYAKSMMEHGVSIRDEWVIPDRDMQYGVINLEGKLEKLEEKPTAYVCNSDLTASMLIKQLEDQGYRIPEDISVVGFDNYLYPGLCDVDITTYEVDMKEMARKTIHILLKKMNGEHYKQGISIVEGHLVEKNSVKALTDMP
ncbi:MAG: LacI family DNA-binding transcriptional regulator [Lachnospiraceae bacterium]|nr:LacI family DNA-binding transcriptional regulator [Lachnospiraceae bacterium]MEE1250674.1 LacI family DNA-binding transcriptional regulator [Lachnospiraceae bacterium]